MAIQTPIWTAGEFLHKARRDAGVSTAVMADRLGVSPKTINNYEENRTRPSKAVVEIWAQHCEAGWLTWDLVRDLLLAAPGWVSEFAA